MSRRAVPLLLLSRALWIWLIAATPAAAQVPLWTVRGQPEDTGSSIDVARAGSVLVSAGLVGGAGTSQWHVRAVDARTGAVRWEDRYGDPINGQARDVAIEDGRAFVAGWVGTPGLGFEFVVRAYDAETGAVVWTQSVHLGPQCGEESPGFARCVAKTLAVDRGRVFAVGHVTRTAGRSDFAVFAFDAATGAPLWERVTDASDGDFDFAWAVGVDGGRVLVVGETGSFSGLMLQALDARTGEVHWQRTVPGGQNFTLKDQLAAGGGTVFISGADAAFHPLVQAYDAISGALRWEYRDVRGDRIGNIAAIVLDDAGRGHGASGAERGARGRSRLYANGIAGCHPVTFVECTLSVLAFDTDTGLVWERQETARGGDWSSGRVAATEGRVVATGLEQFEDGAYHPRVRVYDRHGRLQSEAAFVDGTAQAPLGLSGRINSILVHGDRLIVGGSQFGAPPALASLIRAWRLHGGGHPD
jgi:outer membrane protein assembly factor BamB